MPVQRVRRVIRKIDAWTVLKVSLVFNAVMALVTVLGSVVFWSVFVNAGIPERLNELAVTIGIENGITLNGPTYFRIVVLLAVVGTIMMTGLFTLGAVVYNLISDLVGGVEFVVLEESGAARRAGRGVSLPVTVAAPETRGALRPLPKVAPLTPPPAPAGPDGSPAEGTASTRRTGS